MAAAGNANTTATAAETGRATAATLQTRETSEGLAEKACEQAGMAHTAYMDAKAASEDAAAADNVTDAVRAQFMAENARDAAQAAETKAGEYSQDSKDAADAELMIVDTVKTVGDTSIDAAASRSVVTTGEGESAQVEDTGLQKKGDQPMTDGPATAGKAAVAKSEPGADLAVAYVAPVVNAAERSMLTIGKKVDSADDTARLMIVTQYAGTKTVKVYAIGDNNTQVTGRLLSDGRIQTRGIADGSADEDGFVTLKSVGMYYPAANDTGSNAATELEAMNPAEDGALQGDTVGPDAKPKEVFLASGTGVDGDAVVDMYVVRSGSSTDGDGNITVMFFVADIHIEIDRDGNGDPDNVGVTAKIPEATDYEHIHFGVWAALGDAETDGSQVPADLGIGFVQNFSGEGLTGADMPNNGTAEYTSGNWVAAVRVADDNGNGDISLESGAASLKADFDKADITATLDGLATLEGDIDTNTFSGTKATVGSDNGHRLDSDGEFTGSFSGGFYGTKAAEAGGVFAFTSEDKEAGEFSGAFGADRD